MFKRINIAILAMLLSVASYPLQVIGHEQLGEITYPMSKQFVHDIHADWLQPVVMPLSGIASHMGADYFVNEGYLGEYQVLRGGIKLITILLTYPEETRSDHFWIAFWNIFPDLWDKGLNRNDFHRLVPSGYVFSFTREGEEVFEDLLVANRVWRSITPHGTLIDWTIPL